MPADRWDGGLPVVRNILSAIVVLASPDTRTMAIPALPAAVAMAVIVSLMGELTVTRDYLKK